MELHRKYRPGDFHEFIGNDALIKSLKSTIGRKHVYLFHGPKGCGKTTLARLVGSALKIEDVFEYNAADRTGVDDARKLIRDVQLLPARGDRKMYIIDEIHRMSPNAQDDLLKTLEEPPDHVFFALCTTKPGKLVDTIRSRAGECYKVTRFKKKPMLVLLEWVIKTEEIKITDNVFVAIIDNAEGIPRDALIMLDMVRDMEDPDDALDLLEQKIDTTPEIADLCRLLVKKGKWKEVSTILRDLEEDPEDVRHVILSWMRKVLLDSESDHIATVIELFEDNFYDSGKAGLAVAVYKACI